MRMWICRSGKMESFDPWKTSRSGESVLMPSMSGPVCRQQRKPPRPIASSKYANGRACQTCKDTSLRPIKQAWLHRLPSKSSDTRAGSQSTKGTISAKTSSSCTTVPSKGMNWECKTLKRTFRPRCNTWMSSSAQQPAKSSTGRVTRTTLIKSLKPYTSMPLLAGDRWRHYRSWIRYRLIIVRGSGLREVTQLHNLTSSQMHKHRISHRTFKSIKK